MGDTVRDAMTKNPVTLEATASCADAARAMLDEDIGNVTVMRDGAICGIVTDRDLFVR